MLSDEFEDMLRRYLAFFEVLVQVGHFIDLVLMCHGIHNALSDCELDKCALDLFSGANTTWHVNQLGEKILHFE